MKYTADIFNAENNHHSKNIFFSHEFLKWFNLIVNYRVNLEILFSFSIKKTVFLTEQSNFFLQGKGFKIKFLNNL